jgi:alpha/beta superfamily hydrolase
MHFKVVFRLARALARAGYGVLRFNFRGVGASEGVHDGGRGERDDFRAALDEAVRRGGVPAIAAGFSFGSVIALSVGTEDARVDAMIGAGVPLDRWKFGGLECVEKPALLVSGSRDVFGDAALLRREAASRFRDARVEVVDGADHFFTGHLDELESLAFEFSSARSVEAVR